MSGLPVTIRLLDPPLHEFLSSITELSVEVARQEERGEAVSDHKRLLLKEVMRLHESNPMMGFRGVRLGVIIPELYRMQVRALTRAAIAVERSGKPALVEVMIPLVASQRELLHIRSGLEDEIRLTLTLNNFDMEIKIGSMIETPRAAITADRLSLYSDFFSFGTNDLTQLTWAFSRDDVEASFLPGVPGSSFFISFISDLKIRIERPNERAESGRRFAPKRTVTTMRSKRMWLGSRRNGIERLLD